MKVLLYYIVVLYHNINIKVLVEVISTELKVFVSHFMFCYKGRYVRNYTMLSFTKALAVDAQPYFFCVENFAEFTKCHVAICSV